MGIVWSDAGKEKVINDIRAGILGGAKVDLFTSNTTPTDTSANGDYTFASWTGYTQQTVASWTGAATDGSHRGYTDSNLLSFDVGAGAGGTNVYGYRVMTSAGDYLFAEAFGGGPLVTEEGVPILFIIRVRDKTP